MQGEHRATRMLWLALLLAVLVYVVVDFAQHPFVGANSEAAVAPRSHLTLWLAATEASEQADTTVRATADSLLLGGQAATVGVLPGGSSEAVMRFLSRRRPADELLVVTADTVADLAQERASTLLGEDPLRAALAQHLLARAIPVGVLSEDALTIAVPPASQIRDVAQLMGQLRAAPWAHVFATTDENWAEDDLAALVQEAGVEGVVPYRVYPSVQEAALAPTAEAADVVLAPRSALLPELRADRLRALSWDANAGARPAPLWVELLAAPGTPPRQVAALRLRLWRLDRGTSRPRLAREAERAPAHWFSSTWLHRFLVAQMAEAAQLQQIALRLERPR